MSLEDLEPAARRQVPKPLFAFVSGGAETNHNLHDNRDAFREIGLIPRALRGVAGRSQSVELFGETYASPFGVAPMGLSALIAYRGDITLARGSGHGIAWHRPACGNDNRASEFSVGEVLLMNFTDLCPLV